MQRDDYDYTGVTPFDPSTIPAGGPSPRQTGPVTDPNDPRLADPAYASDPDVLAFLNSIYGPGGRVFNPPSSESTWNSQQQDWNTAGAGGSGESGGDGGYGGGGGFQSTIGNLTAPFTGQAPALPGTGTSYIPETPSYTAPQFHAPQFTAPAPFQMPTYADAQNDPGYQFTLGQGTKALLMNRASRGLTNTGATGQALTDYGQAAGTTQYNNVLSRNLDQYLTNYKTQNVDPYNFAFQNAAAEFAPQMAQFNANVGAGQNAYSTQAAAGQRANEFNYQSAYNQWLQDYNIFRNQQTDTYNKISPVLMA